MIRSIHVDRQSDLADAIETTSGEFSIKSAYGLADREIIGWERRTLFGR